MPTSIPGVLPAMLLQRLSICILILGTLEFTIASYAIKGCQGGVNSTTGQRPFRQEFSSFQASGAAFDLYIQALQQLIQKNQLEQLSFYQVAGKLFVPLRTALSLIVVRNSWVSTKAYCYLYPIAHNSQLSKYSLGWSDWGRVRSRLLYTCFDSFSNLAQAICGAVRGSMARYLDVEIMLKLTISSNFFGRTANRSRPPTQLTIELHIKLLQRHSACLTGIGR